MHKPTRTRLTVTEGRSDDPRTPKHLPFKKRANRRRRNWNRTLKQCALCLFLVEAGLLLFANPALRVTQVRVEGAQTLTPQQIYEEARVPRRTNIFWMLRQPFVRRLQSDPLVDHAARSIELPNRLVLTVTERQPRAVLAGRGQFWLLDKKGVPYQELDRPLPHLPVVQVAQAVLPADVTLGKPLRTPWLTGAFRLLTLLDATPSLGGAKITVDQNLNLCLNRKDNLQIRLGQPDSLPQKVTLAAVTVGALARQAAYIDVSCPWQPVYMPREETDKETDKETDNGPSDQDTETPSRRQDEPNGPESRTN